MAIIVVLYTQLDAQSDVADGFKSFNHTRCYSIAYVLQIHRQKQVV